MKTNILAILLIASIAINIVYIIKSSSIEEKKQAIKQNLIIKKPVIKDIPNLSDIQKKQLRKIIKEFKITLSDYKNQILAKRIDIIDELSNPDFSLEELKKATTELNKSENELNFYFVESLGKINRVMNPEQRMKLLIKFSRYWFFLKNNKRGRRQR